MLQTDGLTTDYIDDQLEKYYEGLKQSIKIVNSSEILAVRGDMKSKVERTKNKQIVGRHGIGNRNDRGDMLVQFCEKNQPSSVTHFPTRTY